MRVPNFRTRFAVSGWHRPIHKAIAQIYDTVYRVNDVVYSIKR